MLVRRINKPLIVDADGLNALADHPEILRNCPAPLRVLTPHPGEMARLLHCSKKPLASQRRRIAESFAREFNCVLVLKGSASVVAGEAGQVYINKTGNPGMATAGSGDVLCGMIAAFLAQGLPGFDAAKYAVSD